MNTNPLEATDATVTWNYRRSGHTIPIVYNRWPGDRLGEFEIAHEHRQIALRTGLDYDGLNQVADIFRHGWNEAVGRTAR